MFNNMFLYIKRNKSGFPWIFIEPENWFPMISGHGTEKLLSMAFEILRAWDNSKSCPSDKWGFCSTTKSFKKFLYDFIHFPCVLITSHPLKTFRIMVNNKQLLSAMKINSKFGCHLWRCSIFYETIICRLSFLWSSGTCTAFRGHL